MSTEYLQDSLVLAISEDNYEGDALYTISIDGQQVGGVRIARASHAMGQNETVTIDGYYLVGPHTVTVDFLIDRYNGAPSLDRNLYIGRVTYDDTLVSSTPQMLGMAGPVNTAVQDTSSPFGENGPSLLELKISQDAYLGSAQYIISVRHAGA